MNKNPTMTTHRILPAALLALALAVVPAAQAETPLTLVHVHGLSYSADGRQLMIPSHHGLAVYSEGRWSKAEGPAHDYMGFATTRDAIYSSGHPAPGSGLNNPFGLIKSRDGGRSWQKLGLEGESDFHLMAASHGTNAVYVFNPQPNSRMRQAGIHYTLDDGKTWQRAEGRGLPARIQGLAVHPMDAKLVAAATAEGPYLSRNAGQSFERLAGGKQALAVSFDLDGEQLWFSSYASQAQLWRIALKPGAQAAPVKLPALGEDAVAYLAQHPGRPGEIAIATFKRSVYLSPDRGGRWTQIAREGATR
jgi:photosystem II stability/assembly factor-like uncharacterized protein